MSLAVDESSIRTGAQFTWRFHYEFKPTKEVIAILNTTSNDERNLLCFDFLDGKKSNLDSLPLMYDIAVMNMNPRWRQVNKGKETHDSIIKRTIKDKFRYRRTLPVNLPDLEDLFLAIDVVQNKISLVSAFPCMLSSESYSDVVSLDNLSPRNFSNTDILNDEIRILLRRTYPQEFKKTSAGKSLKPDDDNDANYCTQVLPLSRDEGVVYNGHIATFEALHRGYCEARRHVMEINLFDHITVFVYNLAKQTALTPPGSMRIPLDASSEYMHSIYCITPSLARYADNAITRGISITMVGDDPDAIFNNLAAQMWAPTNMANPITAVLRTFDPTVVSHICVAMVKIYTNPNIYTIGLTSSPTELGYTLSGLFSILTFQHIFIHNVVDDSIKYYLTNHIARFIAEQFPMNFAIIGDQCDPKSMSLKEWYTGCDRMRCLYEAYDNLSAPIKPFINLYFGVTVNGDINREIILSEGNSLMLPYAGHRLGKNVARLNFWDERTSYHKGVHFIRPILPYTAQDILEWNGGHLSSLMNAMAVMISKSSSTLKNTAVRYDDALRGGSVRLKGLFMQLINRAYIVATSPYADDQIRDVSNKVKIQLPIDLLSINSCLIFPSALVAESPSLQSPVKIDHDEALQTSLPILRYVMERMRSRVGSYSRALSDNKLFAMALESDLKGNKSNLKVTKSE